MQDAEQPRPAQAASRPAQLWSANVVAAPSSGPRSAAAHSLAKIKWRTAPASIYQPSTKSIKQEHEEMLALYHEAQAAGYVVDPAGGSAVVAVVSATAPPTSLVLPSVVVRLNEVERLDEVERIIERLQSLKKPVFGMDGRGGVISPFNSTATEVKDRWPTSPRSGFDLLAELLTTPAVEPATPLSPARELVDSTKPPRIQVQGRWLLREERVDVRRRLFRDAVHTDMTAVDEEQDEREDGRREH